MLADGKFTPARRCAEFRSRTAVWKHLQSFVSSLERALQPNRGYRLTRAIELPSEDISRVASARDASCAPVLLYRLTNSRLLAITDLPAGKADVCIAEHQSAGRGRRGREWLAPFGGGICLSLSWTFPEPPPQLGALSLAVGVALLRALGSHGASGVRLKWPNDVLVNERKLGGILCELRAEAGGPAYVVIGVGLNARLAEATRRALGESGVNAIDLTR
jgi:BirA family biotin operon repressor/biotin-[acetyl-CoA-carboxylase] ligase